MEYEIGGDERLSVAAVRAVSAVVGREPRSLPPIMTVVDSDALDALFDGQFGGKERTGGRVSFVYCDCRVTVDNAEYLTVEPIVIQERDGDARAPDQRDAS